MDLFVILATCAREALLERTLSSLAQCRLPAGYRGAIVVENGSRGKTEQVVRAAASHLRASYLFQTVGNKSLALNAALEDIRHGLVVFLDDDVRLDANTLDAYARAAAARGPHHYFGGPIESDYEVEPPAWLKNFLPKSVTGWSAGGADGHDPFVIDDPTVHFMGCNWAAFAEDIHRVGGFDSRYGPGSPTGSVGQESEMQHRLTHAGARKVYVPGTTTYHWVPADRCSEAFALARAHREGIRWGLQKKHGSERSVAGYPLPLLRRTLRSWARVQLRRITADPQARFEARYKFQRQCGELRGLALGRDGARSANTTPGRS